MSPNTRPLSPRSIHTAGEGAGRSEAGEGQLRAGVIRRNAGNSSSLIRRMLANA